MVCNVSCRPFVLGGGGHVNHFRTDERGATAIEYAVIIALIVLAIVASFTILGSSSNGLWANVNTKVSSKL